MHVVSELKAALFGDDARFIEGVAQALDAIDGFVTRRCRGSDHAPFAAQIARYRNRRPRYWDYVFRRVNHLPRLSHCCVGGEIVHLIKTHVQRTHPDTAFLSFLADGFGIESPQPGRLDEFVTHAGGGFNGAGIFLPGARQIASDESEKLDTERVANRRGLRRNALRAREAASCRERNARRGCRNSVDEFAPRHFPGMLVRNLARSASLALQSNSRASVPGGAL